MATEVHYTVRQIRQCDLAEVCALTDIEDWNLGLLYHESYHAMNPNHAYVAVLSGGKVISEYIYIYERFSTIYLVRSHLFTSLWYIWKITDMFTNYNYPNSVQFSSL